MAIEALATQSLLTGTEVSSIDVETETATLLTQDLITIEDMRFLCGYFSFLERQGLAAHSTPLEIRIEKRSGAIEAGFLAFGLVPFEASPLRGRRLTSLLWTHSEDLVNERFLMKKHGPYLCGSYPGRSKFFTSAPSLVSSYSKADAIAALGLRGYAKVKKPGPLFVIQAKMTWEDTLQYVQPKVALLYKRRQIHGKWVTQDQFLEATVPGFTTGGLVEIVGKTFEIAAEDLNDLESKGLEIFRFE
jgi:hypothetical protein